MAETLELRLGGRLDGRFVTARELDFAEVRPLIDTLISAAMIESGMEDTPRTGPSGKRGSRSLSDQPDRPLKPVRLALTEAFTPEDTHEFGAVYRFAVGADTEAAISKITAGLAGIGNSRLVPDAAAKVREGISRVIQRGLSIQMENGVETPKFSKRNPPPKLEVHPTRRFESEIAARLIRVGGSRPTARVKLLGSGQDVTLQLSGPKSARELGHHLYRDAILYGSGEWVIDPEKFYAPTRLLKFKVSNYRLLRDTTIDSVIEEMTEATGGIWDGVDPVGADLE